MSEILDAALQYARRGWAVFPCKPGSKEPATTHGVYDASADPRRIERFWRRGPDSNVAVATGGDGPDVLDVDVAHGKPGRQSLQIAMGAGLVGGPMGSVATPSGGRHLYYSGDNQRNGSLPEHGLDFRGEGGYVLAPPSQVDGRPYLVVQAWTSRPSDIDFGQIREHFEPPQSRLQPMWEAGHQLTGRLADWVARQHEGNRNQAAFWAACRAAEAGDADALDAIAEAAVSTGLTRRAVDKTIASAIRTIGQRGLQAQREAGQ